MAANTIFQDVWANDIAKVIFPDNSFVVRSKDDSAFVNRDTIYLPQAGAAPNVLRNVANKPLPVTKRGDTVLSYQTQDFSTEASLVEDVDALEVSYDLRKSVLGDHVSQIQTVVTNWLGYSWSPTNASATLAVRTSSASATVAASMPSATGTRKAITKADILAAKQILDAQDIPLQGRVLVIVPSHYNAILALAEFTEADKISGDVLRSGIVGRLFGIDVYMRSFVSRYDNTATPVLKLPPTEIVNGTPVAGATSDNAGMLMYHPDFVRRAQGQVKVYQEIGSATMQGDVYSALVRAGGSPSYTNRRGVVAIVEAA